MSLYRKLTAEEIAARDALATAEGNPRLDAKLDRLAARKSRKVATDMKVNAARKRKPKPEPAPYRPINKLSDIITSPDDPRLGGNKVETVETPVSSIAPTRARRPLNTRKLPEGDVTPTRQGHERDAPVKPNRSADRHKDPKAHSAKVAARAKIRRAEAKSTGSAT